MVSSPLESVYRFAHEAMGTIFEVAVAGLERKYAEQASMAVFQEFDRLEMLFSRFNPCSEIGQVNRLQAGGSLRIGLEAYECLKTAEQVRLDTSGAFDINYKALPRTRDRGGRGRARHNGQDGNPRYHGRFTNTAKKQPPPLAGGDKGEGVSFDNYTLPGPLPSREREFFPPRYVNNPAYELISGANGFSIRLAGLSKENDPVSLDLDLGGIGKGYALERAAAVLADWNVERALVHSGTSTALAVGSAPGLKNGEEGWPVGVGGRWSASGAPGRVLLRNRALSGSGTEVKGQHIIDPRTGRKAKSHLATWVAHPSAAISDALSTAFMVMGREEVKAYCRRHPEVWALVITSTGKPIIFNAHIFAPALPSS